jgi:hypothetical protein
MVLTNRHWRQSLSNSVYDGGKIEAAADGTEYSNEYVAELQKTRKVDAGDHQGVTERDIELPSEVNVHYLLYCLDLKSGKVEWSKEFHKGPTAQRASSQELLRLRDAGHRWKVYLCVCDQSGFICL